MGSEIMFGSGGAGEIEHCLGEGFEEGGGKGIVYCYWCLERDVNRVSRGDIRSMADSTTSEVHPPLIA